MGSWMLLALVCLGVIPCCMGHNTTCCDTGRVQQIEKILVEQQLSLRAVSKIAVGSSAVPDVSFLVSYSGTRIVTKAPFVQYDRVVFNHGGGFNMKMRRFHAPVPGLYVFHVNASSRTKICLQLQKGVEKVTSGSGMGTANLSVAIPLKKTETVWVSYCLRSTVDSSGANTFSGYLLRPY